jgi:hypothetical protein
LLPWQQAAWGQPLQQGRGRQVQQALLQQLLLVLLVLAGGEQGLTTGKCATLMVCWP